MEEDSTLHIRVRGEQVGVGADVSGEIHRGYGEGIVLIRHAAVQHFIDHPAEFQSEEVVPFYGIYPTLVFVEGYPTGPTDPVHGPAIKTLHAGNDHYPGLNSPSSKYPFNEAEVIRCYCILHAGISPYILRIAQKWWRVYKPR
nr:MAG TPA: hypothetical protein [Caudoviricetes sp.]